jgi:hypothetical protein
MKKKKRHKTSEAFILRYVVPNRVQQTYRKAENVVLKTVELHSEELLIICTLYHISLTVLKLMRMRWT